MLTTSAGEMLLYRTAEVTAAGDRLTAALAAEAGFSRLHSDDLSGDVLELWAHSRRVVDRAMAEYSLAIDRLIDVTIRLPYTNGANSR